MPSSRNFVPIPGSERLRPTSHRRIGAADAAARIGVTIVVRPRPGSPPLPDLAHWQSTPPGKRKFLKPEEYARIHGAAQADMDAVAAFAAEHGLTVSSSHTGRRHVTVEGTAAQMNAAFGITLHRYEAPLPSAGRRTEKEPAPAPPRRRGRTNEHATPAAETYTHHGYDGAVHIPKELEGIILAVVGLDDRLLGVPAGSGNDPSGASSLEPPTVAQLYNFPNSGASDQTIGVIAPQSTPGNGASYLPNDITGSYFPNLTNAAYRTAPASINNINLTVGTNTFSNSTTTVQGITSTTNLNAFPFSFIIELTQDISTSATIAQGATVNVYFTQASEQGWLVFLNRVLLPQGEKQPTVVTCSFTIYQGDDSSYIGSLSNSGSAASLMSTAFQALAAQGINVFIAIGDWGADNWWSLGGTSPTAPDGSSHVMYPGTDPWVTACGGTVVASNSSPPPAFNENVWSDAWSTSGFGSSTSNFGATGGGVSATFPAPPYQTAAGITGATDLAGTAHSGRGVPDIAGMVGLTGFFVNGLSYNFTGTSCVAPLYAGFAAVLRSAFGVELGFFNSILYQLPSSAFNQVTSGNNDSHDTPANVAIAIPGYTGTTADAPFFTAGSGWDACTGLGSVAGSNFLNGLAGLMYNQTFYFQAQKSTYGLDEVSANASTSGDSTYSSSSPSGPPFWLVLEGFTPAAVAAVPIPKVAGALTLENVTVTVGAAQPELPSQTNTPQRILFPCGIEFPKSAIKSIAGGGVFPNPGQASFDLPLSALMSGLGQPLSASMVFELTAGEDPSFANFTSISTNADNVFYLSNDLRVFTVTPGVNTTPVAGVAWPGTNFTSFDTASAYGYLKSLLNTLNGNSSFNSGASDPFTQLPDQSSALTGDSSVTPFSINPTSPLGTPFNNYNFAIARVRVNGAAGNSTVKNVRVFFRLFATETSDTDYQPALTYPSSSDVGGQPGAPLLGIGNVTIPFFATGNYQANSDFGIQQRLSVQRNVAQQLPHHHPVERHGLGLFRLLSECLSDRQYDQRSGRADDAAEHARLRRGADRLRRRADPDQRRHGGRPGKFGQARPTQSRRHLFRQSRAGRSSPHSPDLRCQAKPDAERNQGGPPRLSRRTDDRLGKYAGRGGRQHLLAAGQGERRPVVRGQPLFDPPAFGRGSLHRAMQGAARLHLRTHPARKRAEFRRPLHRRSAAGRIERAGLHHFRSPDFNAPCGRESAALADQDRGARRGESRRAGEDHAQLAPGRRLLCSAHPRHDEARDAACRGDDLLHPQVEIRADGADQPLAPRPRALSRLHRGAHPWARRQFRDDRAVALRPAA